MPRAFLIVIDSVGIGGAPDADQFFNGDLADTGANTIAHIARDAGLHVPTLDRLGLGAAVKLASGAEAPGLGAVPTGAWGAATEVSPGKDTPSGHWELSGVPVPWDWHVFPDTTPAFPADLTERICAAAGTTGILGNCHASGTAIIAEEGEAHLQTGWPICYTSADSVLQIAAHEESFGLARLLERGISRARRTARISPLPRQRRRFATMSMTRGARFMRSAKSVISSRCGVLMICARGAMRP
jgi:phosphopentomutase